MQTLLYRNRQLLFMVIGVVVALASFAIAEIGRQEDPTITNVFGTIVAPLPGASPSRVEALVTEKIEAKLREIAEIAEITSSSRTGVAVLRVELSKYISKGDLEQIWAEIRDALSDASTELPPNAIAPKLDTNRTSAYTAISAISMKGDRLVNPSILRRYASLLQDELRRINNTQYVRLFGEQSEEIRVTLQSDKLTALGISFDQVANAISQADVKVRAGQLQSENFDLLVELKGEINSLQRIRDIPISTDNIGAALRLGDLATIERSIKEPSVELAFANGIPAVLVASRMENDRQVDVWASDMRTVITEFEATLPDGLSHELLFDQSTYTKQRFIDLGQNMLIGIGLVILVLFFSLGWRSALIVASVIPLATLGSLTILQLLGLPIQQMSVTGLIVALGLLVDAAIVMSDEIKQRLDAGHGAITAVKKSVNRLILPLTGSTITTVLSFLPMLLLPGAPGDFVGSIALAVITMLLVSLILAITVTPAIAGRLLKATPNAGNFLQRGVQPKWLQQIFHASLKLSLRHKGLSILAALILPVMGFLSFPTLSAQFFPGVDRDQLHIQVSLPSGASIQDTKELALEIDEVIAQHPSIKSHHWLVGENAPAFFYNMVANRDGTPSFAEALITTISPQSTEVLIPELQSLVDQIFPQAQILVHGLKQGPPVPAPIEMRIVGPNLEILRRQGEVLRALFTRIPQITHTSASLVGADPKLVFSLSEEKVQFLGLDLSDVARQMEAALTGSVGGSMVEGTEELPVRVRLAKNRRDSINALRSIMIVAPNAPAIITQGKFPGIPLSTLGTLELKPSDSPIARRNSERVNSVLGFVKRDVLPEEVQKQIFGQLAKTPLSLPDGYRLEEGGDADARKETAQNLAATGKIVVVLSIVTIFLTFMSFRLALITLAVSLLSMGLSLLALAIFQYPFGITALIGSIGSIGVSINASIIILTALQNNSKAMNGDLTEIRLTVGKSARHITSTTITTVGGFTPLILGGGGFWPPFAMAIAGGVLLSMVISFYFTPQMFALFVARKQARESLERVIHYE